MFKKPSPNGWRDCLVDCHTRSTLLHSRRVREEKNKQVLKGLRIAKMCQRNTHATLHKQYLQNIFFRLQNKETTCDVNYKQVL